MLSPPKPLDEIEPNWCVSYLHEWDAQRQIFFGPAPPPGALGRGQKVKYNLISITKSISKIFIPNFMCVLTNEKYKIYQTGFLFCRLGHALGVGLGVLRGQNRISSCCLSVMLSPPKPLDEIEPNSVCELLTWGVQRHFFLPRPLGPWGGVKRSNIIKYNYKVNFKDF